MNIEALIVLIYIRYLNKTLKNFSPNKEWEKIFKYGFYATLILLTAELIFKIEYITFWFWTLAEAILVIITYKLDIFAPARKLMLGLIPLMILLFVQGLLESIFPAVYDTVDKYLSLATAIAVTWMVAMIWLSNKERKALEKERQKRILEEERHKIIEAQKNELERLVAERTLEITRQKEELESTLVELQSTQKQLIQSEKMASLGELTAGIAHEIQNPLNFVNNFSEVSVELINEMKEEIASGNSNAVIDIASDLENNLQKITHHGKRADAIVKGMLLHSRTSSGSKELSDINALADEYLRLSYHGLRAKDKNFNANMVTRYDDKIGLINIIPQDVGRVLLNLYTNAFYSVFAKKKQLNEKDSKYNPTVTVETRLIKSVVEGEPDFACICVSDNGIGIPQKVLDKIYQPFFTTKPSGEGTGLGLSLSYDIIYKGHNGTMEVKTKEGEYAEFIINLPIYR